MPICLSHQSALELFRLIDEKLLRGLSQPRAGRLESCGLAHAYEELQSFGIVESLSRPVHLLVSRAGAPRRRKGIVRHLCNAELPSRAIWKLSDELNVVSPAFCLMQSLTYLSEVEAALVAFEFCGSYCLAKASDGSRELFDRTFSLTSRQKIENLVDSLAGAHGAKTLRAMTSYLKDGSESPMETAMAMMLTAPTRIGGMGLKGAALNKEVATADGVKRIDLLWSKRKLGLEYQGVDFHEGWSKRIKDDQRRNAISAQGITILPVYFQDLATPRMFDLLVDDIAKAGGFRVRITMKDFRYRQMLLRSKVLPPVNMR